jgi:hypothetical protein
MFEGDVKLDDAYARQEWKRQREERETEQRQKAVPVLGGHAVSQTTVIPYGGTELPTIIIDRTINEIPYA